MSLPELPFDPVVIVDGFAYVSGQIATDAESELVAQGRVGAEVDVGHGRPLRGGVRPQRAPSARSGCRAGSIASSGS